jgi:carboxymethylenebutenolidase
LSAAPAGAGYRARPAAAPRGAIIVVHEIFGLTPHIRSICDRLAAAGYSAHAPDLFAEALGGGFLPYTKEGKDRGLAIKNAAGEAQLAAQVVSAASGDAAAAVAGPSGKVGVIGFCLGGTLAWLAAGQAPVSCAVGYYSVGIARHLGVQPRGPVQMHFGNADPSIKAEEVDALRAAHPAVDVQVYEAGHAFNRDDDAPFNRECAALAWQRSLAFVASHLG